MKKKARLILAQIDHVSGEVIGFAVGKIMELGANNVQLIPAITKKNRPGSVIIIDTDTDHENEVANFLAKELKVSGYHRVSTSHIFHKVTFVRKKLRVAANGKTKLFQCEIKVIGNPSNPLSVDIDHDFLVKLQGFLNNKLHSSISLGELRTAIESKLKKSGDEITIDLEGRCLKA